jgi:tetratricopeptide (TPR) repeat protein
MVAVVAVAYAVMLPFWPWGMLHPITGPFVAMGYFSQFLEPHFSFFACKYVLNHDVPWSYVSQWLVLTLPELILLGLVCGLVSLCLCGVRRLEDIETGHIQRIVLIWSALFPIFYAALMKTPFYDGYRHVLFVVPPLVICGALGVRDVWQRIQSVFLQRVFMVGVMGVVIWTGVYMVRIHPNQVVYFNHLVAGGIQKASTCYETDYWGNSYKQGLDWIAENYAWDFSKQKIQVASRFGQLHNVMDITRFERVEVFDEADLYLGTTRFDDHRLTPGEVVHRVLVDGVPILYVIRPDLAYENDPLFADSPFRRMSLRLRFDGEDAADKKAAFLKQVEDQNLHYFVAATYNNMGMAAHQQGQYDQAVSLYKEALTFYPSHLMALYNLGLALYHKAERILDKEKLGNMYYTLGGCYIEKEDFEAAYKILRPLVDQHPNNASYRMYLANALVKRDSIEAALSECQKILDLSPQAIEAYALMVQIYQATGQMALARDAYDAALKIAPDNETLQELVRSVEK